MSSLRLLPMVWPRLKDMVNVELFSLLSSGLAERERWIESIVISCSMHHKLFLQQHCSKGENAELTAPGQFLWLTIFLLTFLLLCIQCAAHSSPPSPHWSCYTLLLAALASTAGTPVVRREPTHLVMLCTYDSDMFRFKVFYQTIATCKTTATSS